MRLEWHNDTRRLSALTAWDANPAAISDAEAARLLESLREFGQVSTIAIEPDGTICDGHQRRQVWAAAQEFGPDFEVAVRVASRKLTRKEREKLAVLLRTAQGHFDWDKLAAWDTGELQGWGLDAATLTAWDDAAANLREMLAAQTAEAAPVDAEAQVDRADELQEKWQVQPGNVWRAGEHYVICGDCREPETWVRLLAAAGVEKVNGVFTSPPYAMQRKEQYGGVETAEYVEWWDAVQSNVRANLAADGSFFVNIKPHCEDGQRVLYVFDLVLAMVRRWGWRFVDELCWKHQGIPGRWDERLKNQFEPVYHFVLGKIKINHSGVVKPFSDNSGNLSVYDGIDNRPARTGSPFKQGGKKSAEFDGALSGNVFECPIGDAEGHAAAFPVALPAFFIKAYSDKGDVWLDPFLGSGTTIISAHNEGRIGLGIEKMDKYVAVILERLQDIGLTPELLTQ